MASDNIWYDREGKPISAEDANEKFKDLDYKIVARATLEKEEIYVSTVWLGINHNFFDNESPPLIFETMTFLEGQRHDAHAAIVEVEEGKGRFFDIGDKWHQACWRYATEQEAIAGHAAVVNAIKAGLAPDDVDLP